MKWVKSVDKFPVETQNYFLRHRYEDGRWHGWWAYVVPEAIDKGVWLNLNYEWLDESADEWVSVEDGLPDDLEDVLGCHIEAGSVDIVYFSFEDSKWQMLDKGDEIEVLITHWRPIPAKPLNV